MIKVFGISSFDTEFSAQRLSLVDDGAATRIYNIHTSLDSGIVVEFEASLSPTAMSNRHVGKP